MLCVSTSVARTTTEPHKHSLTARRQTVYCGHYVDDVILYKTHSTYQSERPKPKCWSVSH